MDRGEWRAAAEVVGILEQSAERLRKENQVQAAFFHDARSRLRALGGRREEALAEHLEAGRFASLLTQNPAVLPWRSRAALVAHQLGDQALAQKLVHEALERALATEIPRSIARAQRVVGTIEGGDTGLAALHESVSRLEPVGAPVELAFSLLGLGAALRRSGRRGEAIGALRRALEVADGSGAMGTVEEVRAELHAAGVRPRRTALSGVRALTASELRVATLAADGLSNRDIAQTLFVTVHAVDKHLRGVYQKLDISSRKDLSRALAAEA